MRAQRDFPILYGGAVNNENAEVIIQTASVDGLLLGRASIQVEQVNAITKLLDASC